MISRVVKSTNDENWTQIWEIYSESFPEYEQRRIENQIDAMRDNRFCCSTYSEGDELIGILFYWEWKQYRYIEHFAISPDFRSKGYGSKILKDFCNCSDTIILEIDPPVDDMSKARLQFYRNLGFIMNDIPHIHPPYRSSYKGHSLKVLSCPKPLKSLDYDDFNCFLKDQVMKYSESSNLEES